MIDKENLTGEHLSSENERNFQVIQDSVDNHQTITKDFYLCLIDDRLFITTPAIKTSLIESSASFAIDKKMKDKLVKQGIPFRTPNPSHVIALQIAPTFGVIIPLLSNLPIAFSLITVLCLIAHCLVASRYSCNSYPYNLHLDNAKTTIIGLFLGIATFKACINTEFYIRSMAVATTVTAWSFIISLLKHHIEHGTTSLLRSANQWWINIGFQQFISIFLVISSLYGIDQLFGSDQAVRCTLRTLAAAAIIMTTDVVMKRLNPYRLFASSRHVEQHHIQEVNEQPSP